MKKIFKTIIKDFQTKPLPDLVKRSLDIPLDSSKIITLIGSRRSGKTFSIYQIISDLLKSASMEKIVYVNFEDERLDIDKTNFQDLLDAYSELYPEITLSEVYFIFDEIQEITGWEKFVRRVYDSVSSHIFLTGSSAKLLSKEIATSLRGRTLTYEIFPLTFEEFLKFNSVDTSDLYSTKNKAKFLSFFERFLQEGSYPEIILQNTSLQTKILQTYYDVMIYRDIIERYSISNVDVLKRFISKSINNISNDLSVKKFFDDLKSEGFKISKDTLYSFYRYLEDIYLFFYVPKYDSSVRKQELSSKKIYAIDTGLVNAVSFKFSENKGDLLENSVYLHLRKQGKSIYYYKDVVECDFVILEKNSISQAIQVSLDISDEGTKQRELKGLLIAMNEFNLDEGLLLTYDFEDEFEVEGKKIVVTPVWKWMLEN